MKAVFISVVLVMAEAMAFAQTNFGTQPGNEAVILLPAQISSSFYERDFAISKDGNEVFYSLVIDEKKARLVHRIFKNGTWSKPMALPFSTDTHDIEPALSPDGSQLFFASSRSGNFDIYVSQRTADGAWGAPENLGAPVNTSGNEYYPSVTEDGTIFYTAKYEGGLGGEDIWYCKKEGSSYSKPQPLPAGVNSTRDEYNAFVDPKGRYILFGSYGRPDDLGRGDIYKSVKTASGEWLPAEHLSNNINSAALDYCPYVSPDGRYLFFSTERTLETARPTNPFNGYEIMKGVATPKAGGNIFWVSFD